MSSSCINTPPAIPDSLSDFELLKLSERLKPYTWLIKASYKDKGKDFETYGTGFALKVDKEAFGKSIEESDLVLMTCAHILPKLPNSVAVRRFGDNSFLEAEVLGRRARWDTTLLVVKGANWGNYAEAEFCGDGSISDCQTLVHVGHSDDMLWSIFVGRSAYPCVDDLPSGHIRTCAEFPRIDLTETPNCRLMGHILNKPYFAAHKSEKISFEKNLDPWIPIIQCNGFVCRKGCSGGPVFNTQGKVVGMVVGEFDGCQTAIHVALLKEFVKINTTNPQGSSKVNENVKQPAGGGEDAPRGSKRKEGPM